MATERQQPSASPEQRLSPEQLQEAKDLGIRPLTFLFLMDSIENDLLSRLEPRTKKLIMTYFSTNRSLEDLSPIAQVETPSAIGTIIKKGMTEMWQNLPEDLKEQYPEEETIALKKPNRRPPANSTAKVVESRREKREQKETSQRD